MLIKNYYRKKKIIFHIRRADVNPSENHDRWLTDEYYIDVLNKIKQKYNMDDYEVVIYTQRRNFDFEKFKNEIVIFDDEIEDHVVWKNMVNADVLIISKSAFSYSAGMLCDGLVIYPSDNMFHPKLGDWIKIEEL